MTQHISTSPSSFPTFPLEMLISVLVLLILEAKSPFFTINQDLHEEPGEEDIEEVSLQGRLG